MITIIGIIVIIVGLLVYVGQSLSFLAPELATKIGLNDPEEEMDDSLYIIETKANGLSDILLTWTFPLAGLLMILDHAAWPYLALVGSGVYLYFACLTIFCRYFLQKHGKKAGSARDVKLAYVFSVLWICSSFAMLALGIQELANH